MRRSDKLEERAGVSEFEYDLPFIFIISALTFISYITFIQIYYVGNNSV